MESKGSARAWMTLLRAPSLGAAALRRSVASKGGPVAAIEALRCDPQVGADTKRWLTAPDATRLDLDETWLAAEAHHLIPFDSDDFPALLRDIPSAPPALFVIGDPTTLWLPQIAIVGARKASAAGVANARAFARAFVAAGFAVTSGLAEGVDGAAHAATLDAGGKTVAVFGTGIDLVYPRRHASLAQRIAAGGALVSEFPPGTTAQPHFFPRRNRLISGLSLGTLVVEAGLKSGSLTTARFAADQGREVFALPGSIHNPLSRGCHRLIRDGAKLVETAQDVLEDLHAMGATLANGLRKRLDIAPKAPSFAALAKRAVHDPDYACLLDALDDTPAALDELAERTGLPAASLSSMLLVLELDGAVAAENGRFSRTVA